jgi:cytochrome c peroxidase
MHDGSIKTLDAVVRHYNDGFVQRPSLSSEIRALGLSDVEIADLVAFMRALSSLDDAISVPDLPNKEQE